MPKHHASKRKACSGHGGMPPYNLLVDKSHVVFEVLTEVITKSSVFLIITPCIPLNVNQRFGGKMSPPSSEYEE
jgi:hypothetical protein